MRTNSDTFQAVFSLIKKFLPEILFTILFLYSYLPYFIYCPVPVLRDDSYGQLLIAKDIYEGAIPLSSNYGIDWPYGLSLFICFVFSLGLSLDSLVVIQTFVCLFCAISLIRQVKQLAYRLAMAVSVILFLFFSLSDCMWYNVMLYTESLYISALMIIVAFTIRQFVKKSIINIYAVLFGILIAILLRTNALFLLFIPFLLLIEYLNERNKQWKHVMIATFSVFIINSICNFYIKGYFAPGNFKRIVWLFEDFGRREADNNSKRADTLKKRSVNKQVSIFDLRNPNIAFFSNMANDTMGNFYYYRIPCAFNNFSEDSMSEFIKKRQIIEAFKTYSEPSEPFVKFIVKNYNFRKAPFIDIRNVTNIEIKPRNAWLYSIHLLHLCRDLIRNYLWVILFYLIYFVSIFKLFKRNSLNYLSWKLVFYLSSIHVASLVCIAAFALSDYGSSRARYAIVTEFIAYLSILLGSYLLIFRNEKLINNDQ